MADEYIKREDATNCALGVMAVISCGVSEDDARRIISAFRSIPSADVQPVRHGRWEKNDDGIMVWWECSECHRNAWYDGDNLFDYCPDCGARMDKQEGSAEYDPDKFFGRK